MILSTQCCNDIPSQMRVSSFSLSMPGMTSPRLSPKRQQGIDFPISWRLWIARNSIEFESFSCLLSFVLTYALICTPDLQFSLTYSIWSWPEWSFSKPRGSCGNCCKKPGKRPKTRLVGTKKPWATMLGLTVTKPGCFKASRNHRAPDESIRVTGTLDVQSFPHVLNAWVQCPHIEALPLSSDVPNWTTWRTEWHTGDIEIFKGFRRDFVSFFGIHRVTSHVPFRSRLLCL